MQNKSLMREHEDRALIAAKKTHFPQEGRRFDIVHLDKVRTAGVSSSCSWKEDYHLSTISTLVEPFLNGSNSQGLQTEEMRQATEIQRATCDYLYVVMFRLYYLEGKDVCKAGDLCGDHAKLKSPLAKKHRQLCEHKFLRLCGATMYYRVWKFENWKEPVYDLFRTVPMDAETMDAETKDEIGLSLISWTHPKIIRGCEG
ncbi:uncharacterized protein RHO25_006678 [Cercospora beticola]|uniref:Uncharacterized protein n=1 Tax=Cercospora beticola TaxID=122368 RepID=A0ABZ0NRF6_CERBT|nr:hypothetical protein RHO25_006678 [Cercospora beticola]